MLNELVLGVVVVLLFWLLNWLELGDVEVKVVPKKVVAVVVVVSWRFESFELLESTVV